MAQLLGPDVHEQVLAGGIFAIEPLDRVLHGGCQLAIRPAELLKEHPTKLRVRLPDAHSVHKLLDVMVHESPRCLKIMGGPARLYHANGLPQEDQCRSLFSGKKSYREERFITIKSTSRIVKKAGLNKAGLNYGLTLRTIISHDCPGGPYSAHPWTIPG